MIRWEVVGILDTRVVVELWTNVVVGILDWIESGDARRSDDDALYSACLDGSVEDVVDTSDRAIDDLCGIIAEAGVCREMHETRDACRTPVSPAWDRE